MTATPEPAGIAALPHDSRGIPIPAHVGREPGRPVRITELDPKRLLLLNGTRRCTICAWHIPEDELCWYHTTPEANDLMQADHYGRWDACIEGAGHEECMVYASIECPFLNAPEYDRKTTQRRQGEVVQEKGEPRGDIILVGARRMQIRLDQPYPVCLGGGHPRLYSYQWGAELRPVLDELMTTPRQPGADDLEIAAMLATENEDEIVVLATRVGMIAYVRETGSIPSTDPYEPCPCTSGNKFRFCCYPRLREAKQLPRTQW